MKISLESTVLKPLRESFSVSKTQASQVDNVIEKKVVSEMTDALGKTTKEAYQVAVNKMNEFMEATNKNSKFVFHEGLGEYYVEIVDAKTEEVVKEIPPKELLDAYYEMQKMIGKIVDKSI
ncbi:MAG: flagellar protein FlaG [Kurthia sp.]|nr:flagellar protein FlaG [Candidatus Kurthia equi]